MLDVRLLLFILHTLSLTGTTLTSNMCQKTDVSITDPKVTVKSFTPSFELTKEDVVTSKFVVGCPTGYQMRVDYSWNFQTYEQPNGNTLIELNCSQLYALDNVQICYEGCSVPKIENILITPLPAQDKAGPSYSNGDTIKVQCGPDSKTSVCRGNVWNNLSEYNCPYKNTSARSLALVIDTTSKMGVEIEQIYEIATGIVDKVQSQAASYKVNYVLVPFNDPDFYPMVTSLNGTTMLRHLKTINDHGASGGMDCPELSLAAIVKAVRESYEGSEIFVFTDASSKDPEKKVEIIGEATRKKIKINFILTGHCGENQMQDQALYYEIAEATAGVMVNVEKTEIRSLYSMIEGSLLTRAQDIVYSREGVEAGANHTVQIPTDKTVHRLTVSAVCQDVRILGVRDELQNQLQYNWMVDLDNAASVMVLPSKSESLSVDVSCSERTSALVTASAVTDIKVDYKFYYRELGDTMVEFDTVDAGKNTFLYITFSAAVYDVAVSTLIMNEESGSVGLKKYLGGFIAEFDVPQYSFILKIKAKYTGQELQRLSHPIVPRKGCPALKLSGRGLVPSTILTRDQTRVTFKCKSNCDTLSSSNDVFCSGDQWSNDPPRCVDAGYTCGQLSAPGNGTLLTDNHVVYKLTSGRCDQSVEIHCNTYFEVHQDERTATCTPQGWDNKVEQCVPTNDDNGTTEQVTRVLLGEWWLWLVIGVATAITVSVMFTITCVVVIRKRKRKPGRVAYSGVLNTGTGTVSVMPETQPLREDDDIYEVVDCRGNYPTSSSTACAPSCNDSILRNRPPLPPPTNAYGNLPNLPNNLPNLPNNPLYSRANGNDYMPMCGPVSGPPSGPYHPISQYPTDQPSMSGDVRSTSMVYEEMRSPEQQLQSGYNEYDYASGFV